MRVTMIAAALVLVAACKNDGPPAPTAQQSDQLNDAEDMLNQVGSNEEGPEDRSPGPSKTAG